MASINDQGKIEHTSANDFFEYTFTCAKADEYDISATVGAAENNRVINISIDGKPVHTYRFNGKGWGDENNFAVTTDTPVAIGEGQHVMRATLTSGGTNLISFKFDSNGSSGIEGVVTEADAPCDVYSIDGYRLRHQVSAATALDGLAPGLYIVGDRKVAKF